MSILEQIISVFAPHRCVGCDAEGKLLCEACLVSMPTVPSRCYRCKAVTVDYATCRKCLRQSPLSQVVVYSYHTDLAKELIHQMKYERARMGTYEIGDILAGLHVNFSEDIVLTHIPTATKRVRARGYDHALLIARALAKQTRTQHYTLLARMGQAHQVGANRSARLRQLITAFRPVRDKYILDKHIVLVDDVLTTGATLETAARTLKRAGAKRVSAIVFAQA